MNLLHTILAILVIYPSVVVIALLVPIFALRWFAVAADRGRTEWLLVTPVFFKGIGVLSLFISKNLSRLRPLKFDLYVFHIDSFFGDPSFHLGQLVASRLWLAILLNISYHGCPVKSRTESVGCERAVTHLGNRNSEVPVKWGFSRRE